MTPTTPSYDNKIARKYSSKTLEEKVKNKLALQEELHWVAEPKRPIVCIPTGMTDALGGKLLEQIMPALEQLPVEILVRGRGSEKYGKMFTELSKNQKHRLAILPDDDVSVRKMLAAADIALFFADAEGSEELEMALAYGVIPIAPESKSLDNYNPVQETGNAFTYENVTVWQCFAALVRALETLKFPYDWRTIQRHAMKGTENVE